MKTEKTCVADDCETDGLVGFFGRWLCLDHFDIELAALKAAGDPRVIRQTALSL